MKKQRSERNKAYRKAYRKKEKLAKLGWTKEMYEVACYIQQGRCLICNEEGQLCCDHIHGDPPIPRALLCVRCNSGLGMFRDRADLLLEAAKYLTRHAGVL